VSEIIDLDILRPEKKIIRLAGKEIDVSFIPLGITFEIDDIVVRLGAMGLRKNAEGKYVKKALAGADLKKMFDETVKLCATFAGYKNPEMDEAWIKDNLNVEQIQVFAEAVKDALERSYRGVEEYSKN
jgi:hypothetical protein